MNFLLKSLDRQAKDEEYLRQLKFRNPDKYFEELQLTTKLVGVDTYETVNEGDRILSSMRAVELDLSHETPFSIDVLKKTHAYLFQDIYYFAGKIRDMAMQLDDVTVFVKPANIEKELVKLEKSIQKDNYLKNLDKPTFCEKFADYWSEYINIHPFREGNGRTGRTVFSELAQQAGYKIDWEAVPHNEWVLADECAFDSRRDYTKEGKDTSYLQILLDKAVSPLTEANKKKVSAASIALPIDENGAFNNLSRGTGFATLPEKEWSEQFLQQMQGMQPRPTAIDKSAASQFAVPKNINE